MAQSILPGQLHTAVLMGRENQNNGIIPGRVNEYLNLLKKRKNDQLAFLQSRFNISYDVFNISESILRLYSVTNLPFSECGQLATFHQTHPLGRAQVSAHNM